MSEIKLKTILMWVISLALVLPGLAIVAFTVERGEYAMLFVAIPMIIYGLILTPTSLNSFQKDLEELREAAIEEGKIITDAADEYRREAEDRVEKLKNADEELVSRLKQSKKLIGSITDRCNVLVADIDIVTEKDLQSSQTYQLNRKLIISKLKKIASDSIEGLRGDGSGVDSTKFVAIAAKADMAGALLVTTVEMICSKLTTNNSHQATKKLLESISAAEILIKAIDSKAKIKAEFMNLLIERLNVEINYLAAKTLAKEEQAEIRELQREEKKVRQEAEKIEKAAALEEEIKRKAIAELEEKMLNKNEAERALFEGELNALKSELADAHQRLERAKSRAQETRQGHVYVISNIGSFGEDVLKIGMTRRLDPMDRVKELGDASVPFTFDVHALIECDDAPALEKQLHREFNDRRVNQVNHRKEFFRVNIDEIESKLESLGIDALVNQVASADQHYQSIKIANEMLTRSAMENAEV